MYSSRLCFDVSFAEKVGYNEDDLRVDGDILEHSNEVHSGELLDIPRTSLYSIVVVLERRKEYRQNDA